MGNLSPCVGLALAAPGESGAAQGDVSGATADRPNVILIMSDDQGVGDYGFYGNSIIRTPSLDRMHSEAGYLSNFYVSPVCAPTRASLMTGRYNYRTRCIDTYMGRAMMDTDEVTIAEILSAAGYRTGIYGKWHLGDCYPMRPVDQGFHESVIHRGGGIGQWSDPIGAEGQYTNPTLIRNGVETPLEGYCTDIYFDEAARFMKESVEADQPFFTYIATNAPHGPFHDVPNELYQEYRNVDFGPILSRPIPAGRRDAEFDKLARIAAMITNIDQNVGRLFQRLQEWKIQDNTIVMYLNDNGPNTWRYVGNMRGKKADVDSGGIRSPMLFHWPARVAAGATSSARCAHIDVLPTILDACHVQVPQRVALDGQSFMSLLDGSSSAACEAQLAERTLVLQSHRGNRPIRYNHFTLLKGPWKLVNPSGFGSETLAAEPRFQLYHLMMDPKQQTDVAPSQPEVVTTLVNEYDRWFDDVSGTRANNYAVPDIIVGASAEPQTVLTAQDLRSETSAASPRRRQSAWHLRTEQSKTFDLELILKDATHSDAMATVTVQGTEYQVPIRGGQQRGHRMSVEFPEGPFLLSATMSVGKRNRNVHQIVISSR